MKRGPKPKGWETFRKRYPKPLEKEFDRLSNEWKKEQEKKNETSINE